MVGNIAWKFHGRISVTVHGPANPTNLEWQQFLRDAVRSGTATHWRNLVVSYGGRPDGEQRKQLGEMLQGRGAPTAILTGSTVVRAAVSALSFFNRNLKAFALDCYCLDCEDGTLLEKRATWSWADGSSATFGWSGSNPNGAVRCSALAYNPTIATWGWVDRSCLSTVHQLDDFAPHSYRVICELPP